MYNSDEILTDLWFGFTLRTNWGLWFTAVFYIIMLFVYC